jgi:hypothetical protein
MTWSKRGFEKKVPEDTREAQRLGLLAHSFADIGLKHGHA